MEIKLQKYLIPFLLLFTNRIIGQTNNYQLETGINTSTSNITPFWLHSNQYGIVPFESQFATFRGGVHREYKALTRIDSNTSVKKKSRFYYGYGFQAVANIGKVNQLLIPEAYLKLRYKAFELYGGRRREIFGIVDSTLSSGSTIWSGNALPMPKIQLSTGGYVLIGKRKVFALNMGYAHGWFDNKTPLKNSFLHQKWFYAKIGKPSWKINLIGGFNHQVQWGGTLNLPYKLTSVVDNTLPASFSDYIYLVSGISLNYSERQGKIDLTKYTSYDLTNRVGNHIGTIDIGIDAKLPKFNISLYKQSIYDDGTLISLGNVVDGLYGFSITNKNYKNSSKKLHLTKFVFEFFNTQNQGGTFGPEQAIPQIRGRDDYFNHGQFINGWAYSQYGIGSPFIIPQNQVNNNLPSNYIYSNPINFFTNNNRVQSIYGAFSLTYTQYINNQTRFSFSKNLGTYRTPFETEIHQLSILNTTTYYSLKHKLLYKFSLGMDRGQLLTKTLGVYFGIQKNFEQKF